MALRRISKSFRNILLIFPVLMLHWSCEEIIDVSLKNDNPRVVIESYITTQSNPFYVRITKSQAYFNQSSFVPVVNASVQIACMSMNEKLNEKGNGYYVGSNTKGIPGMTYTLKITSAGQSYGATVEIPPAVPIDTVYFQPGLFRNDSLNVVVEFRDPSLTENYYRVKLYRNGRYAVNDFYLMTDAFSDGGKIVAPIYYRYFSPRDTVVVELLNLERCTWRYFKGISESIQQGINSQAPGNPPSNLSGGALGIFGAWGSSAYRVIGPEASLKK